MQTIHPDFLDELTQPGRARLELWEFFSSAETDFSPANALFRFGTATSTWQGLSYERRVVSRGEIRRYIDLQKNTVSLTLSNVDLFLSEVASTQPIEGMWAQCRIISFRVPGESLILFGGRCAKPDELDGVTCRLNVEQDFGGDEEQIPARKLDLLCPLARDFKGEACRGGEAITSKLPIYQAATECSGTQRQCVAYGNEENFAGVVFCPIQGTFSYTTEEKKRFLFFFSKTKRRTVSAPWSSVSDAQADTAIPEVGGVVQCEGIGVMHADTGTNVKFLQMFADGPIDGFFNFRIRDEQYLPLPATGTLQLAEGVYGSQGQPSSAQFPGAGQFSGTAWAEGQVVGSDPANANDTSPTTSAVIRGRNNYDLPDATGAFVLKGWTDCGPYMTRWYLINRARLLPSQIDDESVLEAGLKCFAPVLDDTGFEQSVLPTTVTGGVDFRAFAAASGFGAKTIDKILLLMAQGKPITGGYGQLVEAYYRYINQEAPPTFVSGFRRVARRYTSNFRLAEQMALRDFLKDILLPSFNGQLIYSAAGKVQVRTDGPIDTAKVSEFAAALSSSLPVSNARSWIRDTGGLLLIGAHEENSELRRVVRAEYANPPNAVTVSKTEDGSLTLTLSGATLTGATANSAAFVTATLGGSVSAGAKLELIIDDYILTHTAATGDDITAIGGLLAAQVNGHPRISAYVRAVWEGDSTLRIEAKHGVLILDAPTEFAHIPGEECLRVAAAFGGNSPYDQKIGKDSFKWPLGSRQSSVNQVKGEFRSAVNDWAKVPISRNYPEHQKATRKTKPEDLNLSAVDTLHQAARLLKIRGGKRRLGDWFCLFIGYGAALLLDVGDTICASHYSGGKWTRNRPVTIEEISVSPQQEAKVFARLYRSEVYDDAINEFGPIALLPVQGAGASNVDDPPPPPPDDPPSGLLLN